MPKYKKCPRCELNYILENEDYCSVCKDELKGIVVNDLELEEEYAKICPRCGINYVADDAEFCETCRAELAEIASIHNAEDAVWGRGDGNTVSLDELGEAEVEEDLAAEIDDADEDNEPIILDEAMLAELQSEAEEDEEDDEEAVETADDEDDLDFNYDADDFDEEEEEEEEDDETF